MGSGGESPSALNEHKKLVEHYLGEFEKSYLLHYYVSDNLSTKESKYLGIPMIILTATSTVSSTCTALTCSAGIGSIPLLTPGRMVAGPSQRSDNSERSAKTKRQDAPDSGR